MIFEELITENKKQFLDGVRSIAYLIGFDPNYLMFCMWFETGRTLNHKIINKTSGATGLIQFMPATAKSLGTSCELLAKMSNVQQLEYVKKYFLPWKNKIRTFTDVYLTIFFPIAVGKPDSFIIETKALKAEKIALQNPIFDLDQNHEITKHEIKIRLLKMIPGEWKEKFI